MASVLSVVVYMAFNYLLFVLPTLCTAHTNYTILSACLNDHSECLSLSDVAKQPDKYFTTNATLSFTPGDHSLRGELVSIANISGLTFISSSGSNESNPRILCDNSSFSFSSVSDVHIESIGFVSCSLNFSSTMAKLHSCRFDNSTADVGGALAVHNGSNIHLSGKSIFVGNRATKGGAVFADSSNLTFSGQSIFLDNVADHAGGGLYVGKNSVVIFSCNSTFAGNSAEDGGAVCAYASSSVSFCGASTFHNNTAIEYGGALFAQYSNTVSFTGNNTFYDNSVTALYWGGGGGAVCAINSNAVSFSGNSTFSDNRATQTGGAVYVVRCSIVNFSGTTTFHDNSATEYTTTGGGGAVCAVSSNTNFSGTSTFIGNTASEFGGALLAEGSDRVSFHGTSIFHDNTARQRGGAVYARRGNLLFSGACTFRNNTGGRGGAVCVRDGNTAIFNGTSTFHDNTARFVGGAVYAKTKSVTFIGTSTFHSNGAGNDGGAVHSDSSTVSFNGNSTFHSNTATFCGGAVIARESSTVNFIGACTFRSNTAASGGAVCAWDYNTLSFSGTSTFCGNRATTRDPYSVGLSNGGAVYAWDADTLSFEGTTIFHDNEASDGSGGAVYALAFVTVMFSGNSTFSGNVAKVFGGGISSHTESNKVSLNGLCKLTGNKALFGGAISVGSDSTVELTGLIAEITENQAAFGGGIFVKQGILTMSVISGFFSNNIALNPEWMEGGNVVLNASTALSSNSASQSGIGGAILSISSRLSFKGSYFVTANTALFGGGLALAGLEDRVVILKPGTRLAFIGNTAYRRGGGIHIEDDPFTYCIFDSSVKGSVTQACFFQVYFECRFIDEGSWDEHIIQQFMIGINIIFMNNTATESGGDLYGGRLEDCGVCEYYDTDQYLLGREVFQYFTSEQDISGLEIASDALKVCICEEGVPNCSNRTAEFSAYPGETLSLSVVAVGQMDGVVPSVIRAVSSEELNLTSEYATQPTDDNKNCTEVHYPLLTTSVGKTVTLELYSDEPCSTSGYPLTVIIRIRPCPTGFSLSTDRGECNCEDRLRRYTQECNITDQTITRQEGSTFWVGVDHHDHNISSGLILHPHCPFDYCKDEEHVFPLNKTDYQCRNRRSGVLCGGCQSGYSLALGSSRCISDCSNAFLALMFMFIAAGLALVLFLFICNLTVAEGTISGLIFYANILAINQSVFFPSSDDSISTNFLTVFVAWLNLDLGIETCFFSGLDIYSRTWLQFAFPFYIWVMVGLIVYLADISTTVAKLLAHANPVAVLATLFLLSYTKLLRTIVAAFTFTTLSYPKDETRLVWLYDGNVGYWDSKHLVLLLFSLVVFCILYIPYTVFLVCGQWARRRWKLRCISPAKQLYIKTFWDAYYAPYKDRHCYWPGLLLLIRFFILFLSTIINTGTPQDPHTNLLVVIIVVSGLLAWIGHGVYRKKFNNFLEASFLFNLIVLSVGTYQVHLSAGNQAAVIYTSTSVAFITFTVIVAGAVMKQLRNTRLSTFISHQIKITKQTAKDLKDSQDQSVARNQAQNVTVSDVVICRSQTPDFANYRETALDLV